MIFSPKAFDELPLTTFLISDIAGGAPHQAFRLVKPHDPTHYPPRNLTPDNRLLYMFWGSADGGRKSLGRIARDRAFRWVIRPGDPGFDLLDAFKIICDHRRGQPVPLKLLHQALGLPEPTSESSPAPLT